MNMPFSCVIFIFFTPLHLLLSVVVVVIDFVFVIVIGFSTSIIASFTTIAFSLWIICICTGSVSVLCR